MVYIFTNQILNNFNIRKNIQNKFLYQKNNKNQLKQFYTLIVITWRKNILEVSSPMKLFETIQSKRSWQTLGLSSIRSQESETSKYSSSSITLTFFPQFFNFSINNISSGRSLLFPSKAKSRLSNISSDLCFLVYIKLLLSKQLYFFKLMIFLKMDCKIIICIGNFIE